MNVNFELLVVVVKRAVARLEADDDLLYHHHYPYSAASLLLYMIHLVCGMHVHLDQNVVYNCCEFSLGDITRRCRAGGRKGWRERCPFIRSPRKLSYYNLIT